MTSDHILQIFLRVTIQNQIRVAQRIIVDEVIPVSYTHLDVYKRQEYTVGIHADVGVAADIRVVVYDGKDTEPYTK